MSALSTPELSAAGEEPETAASASLGGDAKVSEHDNPGTDLKRGLSARHMQMIAIGGAIGTGLFVASGATVSTAGPGGALVAYSVIGLMVLLLMQSLGEMTAHMPVSGSFQTYATRFVSPSFGFAMGWNYWFNWAITVAAELVAAGIVMSYWLPDVPHWVWAAVFLALLTGLNALSARAYGEGEFWFATIKVITVLVFLVAGVAMILGIMGGNSPGFSNWTKGEAPFHGGWLSIVSVFMIAGFSFQGTELVGVAAIPYTDPTLLRNGETDVASSPFTLVFERAGVAGAAAVMNAVILTAILSAGNSGLYASTRMLHSMALDGHAPKLFSRVNRRGVPIYAMAVTAAVGAVGFVTAIVGEGAAYTWLLNVSGLSGFIVWLGISWCHLRFRKAYVLQGNDLSKLPYKAPLFPFGPMLAFAM